MQVLTSIEFLLGGVKVYETPLVEATAINIPERDAVGFQFDVPLTGLKPGHVCLPGERDRRRGRQLQLPAHGAAHHAAGSRRRLRWPTAAAPKPGRV